MASVDDIDENVIEATIEIDFKSYSSSRMESLKEAIDKLTIENSPLEIIHEVIRYSNLENARNFMSSMLCITACKLVGCNVELVIAHYFCNGNVGCRKQ